MPSSPEYDVAVIGAGPAGSQTARSLADRGFRVVLLEKEAEPGSPVHCTGIVSTECFERYRLPESLIVQSVSSFALLSPSGRRAHVERTSIQAHVLDRAPMDRLFVERAKAAGAELVTSFRVDDVRWTGSSVRLMGTHAATPTRLDARAAVIATGFGTKLPRKAGLGSAGDVVSGCQAVVEADASTELEVLTGASFGDGGYGWVVPWKPGLALTGLMTRRDTMSHLGAHISRLQNSGRIGAVREIYRCRAIPLGAAGSSVADGVLGVGDAVGQVKPTSGGGIYFGLLAADEAASVLATALENGDTTATSLAPYERRWRALLEREIQDGYLLRRLIEQLPDSIVEQMHRLLTVPGLRRFLVGSAPSFDWHSGPLATVLARLRRYTESVQPTAR